MVAYPMDSDHAAMAVNRSVRDRIAMKAGQIRSVVDLIRRRFRQCGTDHRRGRPAASFNAAINEISGLR